MANAMGINLVAGVPIVEEKRGYPLFNRTATTLTKGDVVALNLDFAATAGQAMVGLDPTVNADGATGYLFGAAIAPTTANACHVLLVCESDSVADNEIGRFALSSNDILVKSANGVAAGDFISLYTTDAGTAVDTNAVSGWTRAELDAKALAISLVGIALEANSSGGEANVRCIFDGRAFRSLTGGGA